MKVLAVIPARGGSERLPGKNIKMLAGKPMLQWTVEYIRNQTEPDLVDDIYCTTEDKKIADLARSLGVRIIRRPKLLAGDDVSTWRVMKHVAERLGNAIYVIMQPCVPVRPVGCIERCVDRYCRGKLLYPKSLWTGYAFTGYWEFDGTPDGACYVVDSAGIKKLQHRDLFTWGGHALVPYPKGSCIDVDTQEDFKRAEKYLLRNR